MRREHLGIVRALHWLTVVHVVAQFSLIGVNALIYESAPILSEQIVSGPCRDRARHWRYCRGAGNLSVRVSQPRMGGAAAALAGPSRRMDAYGAVCAADHARSLRLSQARLARVRD